jgi:hypothetical protein
MILTYFHRWLVKQQIPSGSFVAGESHITQVETWSVACRTCVKSSICKPCRICGHDTVGSSRTALGSGTFTTTPRRCWWNIPRSTPFLRGRWSETRDFVGLWTWGWRGGGKPPGTRQSQIELWSELYNWLVVSNIFYFSTMYGIIIPTDQYFSEG